MIKGDIQITDTAINVPPVVQVGENLMSNISLEETGITKIKMGESTKRIDVENQFSRLKKRMRTRARGIF